jgi:hypothetical protein
MPLVSVDRLNFSRSAWTFRLLQVNTQKPVYGMLGHSLVHF